MGKRDLVDETKLKNLSLKFIESEIKSGKWEREGKGGSRKREELL